MTLFIDLQCLYFKQTQRAFNVFKNTLNGLKIDSVDQKFNWLECGNFSPDAGMPGTERVIAFSQLAVKGLKTLCRCNWLICLFYYVNMADWGCDSDLRYLISEICCHFLKHSGVWISFSRHSPKWRVVKNFHLPSQKFKQLSWSIKIVSERGKNPCQAGKWVCIFTRQSWILLTFGELASGYPHPLKIYTRIPDSANEKRHCYDVNMTIMSVIEIWVVQSINLFFNC
jgi:hypothetical protein